MIGRAYRPIKIVIFAPSNGLNPPWPDPREKKVSESDEDREEDLTEKLNRDLYKRKTININRITVNQLNWWTSRILGSEPAQVLTVWFIKKNRDVEPQGRGIRIFSLAVKDKLVISLIFNFQLFFEVPVQNKLDIESKFIFRIRKTL